MESPKEKAQSVIGPLLFLVFINIGIAVTHSKIHHFVGDANVL